MSKNNDREFYGKMQHNFGNSELPLLESREEEYRLITLIKKGDKKALAQFVTANLRLVISIAKRYARYGFLPLDDLIQEGSVGLMAAIKKFDPKRRNRFSTYAIYRIRRSILKALEDKAKTIRNPSYRWQLFFQYKREKMDLLAKKVPKENLHREIARKLRVSKDNLDKLLEEMKDTVSLQEKLSTENDSSELGDMVKDMKIIPSEDKMDIGIVSEIVKTALGDLKKDEQRLYELYFVKDVSLKEIAKKFSCTRDNIKRKLEILVRKLRKNPKILRCKNFLD